MDFINIKKSRLPSLLLLAVFISLITLSFYNCGGGGYSDPNAKATTTSALISAETLNKWVTNGYGTDSYGYDKMVVLDVTRSAPYVAGHVPGAYLFDRDVDLSATRSDGVSETVSQVATKAQTDDLIQRTGIDQNTVIVFTTDGGSAGNLMSLGRAYYNFRYWGFPKERLKILNGNNTTYAAAGFPLETTVPPAPPGSTYSVCQLTQDTSVRASFAEMIAVAEDNDPKTIPVDARSPDEYNGVAGKTTVDFGTGTKVAFEGHVKTAMSQNYSGLLDAEVKLIPKDDLIAAFAAIGVDSSTTEYAYCRTSWRAAITFLALDAVLGWPIKIYDGAWIEWGQMASSDPTLDGSLDPASPWRTDTAARSESITYNKPNAFTVEPVDPANSFALRGDMVNVTDTAICGPGGSPPGTPIAPGY